MRTTTTTPRSSTRIVQVVTLILRMRFTELLHRMLPEFLQDGTEDVVLELGIDDRRTRPAE